MSDVLGVYYGTGNTVTKSGSYTLDPGGLLGILSPADITVSSPDGKPVDATIDLAGLLDLPVTAAATFTVTAEKNTVVTVSAGAVNALTTTTLDANGGTVALAGGLLNAASGVTINLTNGGTFNGSGIISALTGATINFGSGGGTLNLAGSDTGLALLSGASINNFGSGDSIIVENDGTPATVTGVSYDGLLGTSTLTFSNGDTLALQGQYQDTDPQAAGYVSTVADADGEGTVLVCFLAGSMIRTPDADIAVEDLCAGDTIITMVNDAPQPRTITWAGSAHAMVRPELPDDEAGYPVRILKDAISAGVPYKDMLITAEHCLYFEGRFVPARMLVNNTSIFYDRAITSYDYYHIETQEHAVIIADGMLTESYLDTGNRRAFVQKDNVVLLSGSRNLTWAHAAAPLDVSPGFVEPLFRQIAARAAASGHTPQLQAATMTDDADLHLMTQTGAIIHKMREANGFAFFMIPPGVESVRIMSRTSRPSDTIGPYIDDRRQLGVLIRDIKLFEGSVARPITTHLANEAPEGWHDGWYAPENVPCRWTDGQACMSLGTRHPTLMGLLCLEILAGGPYAISSAPPATGLDSVKEDPCAPERAQGPTGHMNAPFTLKAGQVWTGAPPRREIRGIDEVGETQVSFHKQTSRRRFLTYQTTTIMGFRKWIQQSQAVSNDGLSAASMHGFSPSREIGQRIQLLRKAAGLSQQDLANMLGVSRTAVGFWETGRPNRISRHVPRIAKIFGISEEVFLNGQNSEKTQMSITKDEENIINLYRALSIDDRLQAMKRMEMLYRRQK